MTKPIVLVFGAGGAIGKAIATWFDGQGYEVWAGSRDAANKHTDKYFKNFTFNPDISASSLALSKRSVASVVWAQGANLNDNIRNLDINAHRTLYEANVTYVILGLQWLLKNNLLAQSARLCIISSIWQNLAKQDKLSYCVTKSALQGLVQSLAIDLGAEGYIVNAVLPGAIDTPMTQTNLSAMQIAELERLTPLGHLATLDDVANLVGFLCSSNNTGITGQFIAADKGFSNARII